MSYVHIAYTCILKLSSTKAKINNKNRNRSRTNIILAIISGGELVELLGRNW